MNYKEEYIRCLQDKTRQYFIEHYLSTFNADERKEIPFKLFPRQIELLKSFVKYNNTIAIKHRQAGITTVASAWITGQCVFASKNSPETVLCIGNKRDTSEQLVEKIGIFLDQIPRWMWGSDFYSPDPDNPKNTKTIYRSRNKQKIELFNGCKIYARSSGEHAARGISAVSILVFDECAMIEHGVSVYSSAVAATSSVKDAKILMISTPNGKDQLYYKTYMKALKGENNYHPVEFKWFQDLRYNRNLKWYRKNPQNGIVEWDYDTVINKNGSVEYNEERWRNLEKQGWTPTSPWFEEMCKSFNNDSQKIAQELLVSFLGSSDNVVPTEIIEQQANENVVKITEDWKLRDMVVKETWIWEDPIPGHRYICACLPKGEQVLTTQGLKNVEDVTLEDKLYNHLGEPSVIKECKTRLVANEDIVSLKINGIYDTARFTANHPIYASIHNKNVLDNKHHRIWKHDFQFIKASDLSVGSWLKVPNYYRLNTFSIHDIEQLWNDIVSVFPSDSFSCNLLLEEEFWWFCGIWLAEGFIHGNTSRIETVHHINETSIHNRCVNVIEQLFNRKGSTYVREHAHSVNIYFNHKPLVSFLTKNFGHYADGKYISDWIKHMPMNFKLKLLEGYFDGDGHFGYAKSTLTSVSKRLLNDVQDIFFSLGIKCFMCKTCHEGNNVKVFNKRLYNRKNCYQLSLSSSSTYQFLQMLKRKDIVYNKVPRSIKHGCYFSSDYNFIFLKITDIHHEKFSGHVYNFEMADEQHSFCSRFIATHNCDPSSGSGDDNTSIEIIDLDTTDENGIPYFTQVLEYNGKLNGEEVAELINRYAAIYNNALVAVEAIGGYGESVVLALMNLGYPNMYYDETAALKNYTSEYAKELTRKTNEQKLPGFRSNGLRIQMISNFVEMLKNNSFRVRSERVISELDTWVFKNGRPDHMDGMHDDNLTCLAMGLFILQFYMLRSDKTKAKDVSIVKSWYVNNNSNSTFETRHLSPSLTISEQYKMPFYSSSQIAQQEQKRLDAMMLLGGFPTRKR